MKEEGDRYESPHSPVSAVTMVIPAHRELARWLLAHEMDDRPDPRTPVEAAERVITKLSAGVTLLVSSDGYRALLGRALYLARAEYAILDGVRVGTSDVYLEGLGETGGAYDALVALVAQVIGLLARFIGDDLTGNLIQQRWPDAPSERQASSAGRNARER
ncbi:MAG TPA: hypothetical protein VIN74_09425 [Candidatus Limnocylindria bacterium]